MITKYCGETAYLNARIPIELFDRLEAQAKAFDVTRSMLIRSVLEMLFLSRDELKARLDKGDPPMDSPGCPNRIRPQNSTFNNGSLSEKDQYK